MKKIFTLFFTILAVTSFAQVRISQVYPGGGNMSATYNQDFIELFNAGTTTATIGGWSVQQTSVNGTIWIVGAIAAGTTIPVGGYYLIATGTASTTNGIALSTIASADLTITTISMGASSGKVALVNATTALSGGTACGGTSVIDVIGYGSASCFETSPFLATGINTTLAIKRGSNGCTDANNNSTDFALGAVAPRNSSSPVNLCTAPSISAGNNITAMTTSSGVASTSQTYNLSATNLTPAAGDLTITPTTGLEISFNNTTFFSTAQTLAYTGGAITTTPIYVRIAATASQGALSGANVTNTGGGASTAAVVAVAGGVFKNYYSNAAGNLSSVATWGDDLAGTMNQPTDFTAAYTLFNVVNRTTPATLGGNWNVSGIGSKIIIGDGSNPINVTTTATESINATNTVDILTNGELIVGSTTVPIFGTLNTASTVIYDFNGTTTPTDIVNIAVANYHHLTLKNGLKYLRAGNTTVNGDLLIDGTANMNGAGSPFSTIILKGNLTMSNAALIEDSATGFANRFTLNMAGNGTQTINTGTSELRLFRLQRDTTIGLMDVNLNVTAGSKICVGTPNGGDLRLAQKITGTPSFTTLTMGSDAQLAIVRNGAIFTDATGKIGLINSTNANIIINKSTTSASINPGTLKFTPGSSLKDFTVNITTPTKDTINIANNVSITNSLNLTKGVIVMAAGQTLEISDAANVTGGSATSYVDGSLKRNFAAATTKLFPIGKNKQYSPVEITSAIANNYTAQYFKNVYSITTVNAATLTAIPGYGISASEYWDIAQGSAGSADIKYYYNTTSGVVDPALVNIAHFNGTDWDNIGRTANGSDAAGTYVSLNSISNFSPFTFGGIDAALPILLESFTGNLINNVSALQWKSTCENIGDSYTLQYSNDGINFTNIYTVNAIGNCNGNFYKYDHVNATANVNYYRLALQAADGSIKYSNIVALKNGKFNFEAKIISNNYTNQIGLNIIAAKRGTATLSITNANGQQVLKQQISYEAGNQIKYLQTITWSKGIYFANITNGDGNRNTMQFVK